MNREELISTSEAAGILQVSVGWVAALCRNGVLDATKEGGKWAISARSVGNVAGGGEVEPVIVDRVIKKLKENEEARQVGGKIADDSIKDKLIKIIKSVASGVIQGAGMQIGKVIVEVLRSTGWLPF
jgi:hypothetical protein